MSNYPVGCHNAPYDEPEAKETELAVTASFSLFAETKITTWDAVVEYDEDEDGVHSYLDMSNVQADVDFDAQHLTPIQLINALKVMCEDKLRTETDHREVKRLVDLICECNLWSEESFDVEIDE